MITECKKKVEPEFHDRKNNDEATKKSVGPYIIKNSR